MATAATSHDCPLQLSHSLGQRVQMLPGECLHYIMTVHVLSDRQQEDSLKEILFLTNKIDDLNKNIHAQHGRTHVRIIAI